MQKLWLSRFGQEQDNLKAALRWLLDTGQQARALDLCAGMRDFWCVRENHREGRRWLEEGLRSGADLPGLVRARALHALGHMAQMEHDHEQAREWGRQSLALFREAGDPAGIERVLQMLAMTAVYEGDLAQSQEFAARVVTLGRDMGMEELLAAGLNLTGLIAHYSGRSGEAEALYSECLSVAGRVGALQQVVHATSNMAELLLMRGDYERAEPLIAESFQRYFEMGDKSGIAGGLEDMAWVAHYKGQERSAVRLYGAAETMRHTYTLFIPDCVRIIDEDVLSAIKERIDEEAFKSAWAEGRALTMQQAIALAFGKSEPPKH